MRKRERERDKIVFLFFCIELETSDQIYFDVFSRIHFYCILYLYKILPTQQYRTQTNNNTKPSVTHRLLWVWDVELKRRKNESLTIKTFHCKHFSVLNLFYFSLVETFFSFTTKPSLMRSYWWVVLPKGPMASRDIVFDLYQNNVCEGNKIYWDLSVHSIIKVFNWDNIIPHIHIFSNNGQTFEKLSLKCLLIFDKRVLWIIVFFFFKENMSL